MVFSRRSHAVVAVVTLASLAACAEVIGPLAPAAVEPVTALSRQAPAGVTLVQPPAVIVRNQRRHPMEGVVVAFAITAGDGTISPATQATDADGVARLDTWTLGNVPGTNAVTATVEGLAPVTFTVEGFSVAVSINPVTPGLQLGLPGAAAGSPPAVLVRDQSGAPMAGAVVTFAATTGGGSVFPASVTTGPDGLARAASWILGPDPGDNVVTATTAGLVPVTFRASACHQPAIGVGQTIAATLEDLGCSFAAGEFLSFHTLAITAPRVVRIVQSSTDFDSYLLLYRADLRPVAENDDVQNAGDGVTDSELTAFLAPGTYLVAASSVGAKKSGAFSLTVSEADPDVTNCAYAFVMPGVTTSQQLAPGDCDDDDYFTDIFVVRLERFQTVTIEMSSSEVDSYLLFVSASGLTLENDNQGAGTLDARIAYTAPFSGYYSFGASTAAIGETGSYTLVVR